MLWNIIKTLLYIDFIESFNEEYVRFMDKDEFKEKFSDDKKYEYICYLEKNLETILDELVSLIREIKGGSYL